MCSEAAQGKLAQPDSKSAGTAAVNGQLNLTQNAGYA